MIQCELCIHEVDDEDIEALKLEGESYWACPSCVNYYDEKDEVDV